MTIPSHFDEDALFARRPVLIPGDPDAWLRYTYELETVVTHAARLYNFMNDEDPRGVLDEHLADLGDVLNCLLGD